MFSILDKSSSLSIIMEVGVGGGTSSTMKVCGATESF